MYHVFIESKQSTLTNKPKSNPKPNHMEKSIPSHKTTSAKALEKPSDAEYENRGKITTTTTTPSTIRLPKLLIHIKMQHSYPIRHKWNH